MHGGQYWLFNRNRIGRRKGVLKGFVERLVVPFALAVATNRIVRMNFVFSLGDHLDSPDALLQEIDGNETDCTHAPEKRSRNDVQWNACLHDIRF